MPFVPSFLRKKCQKCKKVVKNAKKMSFFLRMSEKSSKFAAQFEKL